MKKYKLKSTNGNGKISESLKGKLAHYLSLGLSIEDACKLSNCSKDKLEILRVDSEFEDFIQECMLKNKEDYLKSIKDSAQGGYWQASAWYLERKYPEEFGKKDIVRHEYEIKIKTFQKILIDIINQESPDIRARLLKRIRDYKYDGSLTMDNSFQPKQLGKMEIDIDED
jgi:transposase